MTPKEKAKELVEKFKTSKLEKGGILVLDKWSSKQCVLICIDEIISMLDIDFIRVNNIIQTKDYWEQVKKEIELI